MRQILINAMFANELRIAETDNGYMYNLNIEDGVSDRIQSNIYKAKIIKEDRGIEAFFVQFSHPPQRNGFLPWHNIHNYNGGVSERDSAEGEGQVAKLNQGDEVIVQVVIDKKGIDDKGATLTADIKLTGKHVILLPKQAGRRNYPRSVNSEEKPKVEALIDQLKVPESMGITLRTSALRVTSDAVGADVHALIDLWNEIQDKSEQSVAPDLLLSDMHIATRIVRDRLNDNVDEVWIDTQEIYDIVMEWSSKYIPDQVNKIKLHDSDVPLFEQHNIAADVKKAYERIVPLPSGGDLIIDYPAALTAIDINSKRGSGATVEDTAYKTNLEAIKEISRQLRLRDIGGQIVIDLIDMKSEDSRKKIMQTFRDYMRTDQGNPKILDMNEFCLLSMTRKRIQPSISDIFETTCTRCTGHGRMRSPQSVAMSIIYDAQSIANDEKTKFISVLTSPEVCATLFNDYRSSIEALEERYNVTLSLTPNQHIEKDYEIKAGINETNATVQSLKNRVTSQHHRSNRGKTNKVEKAVITQKHRKLSLWQRLINRFRFGKLKPVRPFGRRGNRYNRQFKKGDNRQSSREQNRHSNHGQKQGNKNNYNAADRDRPNKSRNNRRRNNSGGRWRDGNRVERAETGNSNTSHTQNKDNNVANAADQTAATPAPQQSPNTDPPKSTTE